MPNNIDELSRLDCGNSSCEKCHPENIKIKECFIGDHFVGYVKGIDWIKPHTLFKWCAVEHIKIQQQRQIHPPSPDVFIPNGEEIVWFRFCPTCGVKLENGEIQV